MSKVAKWIFPVAGGKDGVVGTAKAVVGFLTGNAGLVMDGVRQVAGAGRKGDAQARQASILNLQLGEVPRQAVIGIACTAGSLGDVFSFGGQYGTDTVTRCVNLADHAIDGIEGFYINEVYYPWVGDGLQAAFSNKLSFHFRNASADGYDPPQHVQQNGGWTTSDRMVGITHIWIDWFVDDKVWPQGHPEIRFVLRGLRVYDPRFDPQFGYSGPNPQTWADRSSHRFSRNAKVLRYAYTRGIFVEGRHGDLQHLLIGRGLSEEEAPPELVIADANLCDEIVDGVARYTANGVISAAQPFIEVDGMFAAAMAGVIVQREGTVDVEAGQAKAVVATFTDADLVGGEKVGFSRFLGDSDGGRLNTFIGRYIEPLLGFKDHSAPVRRSLTDIVTDGGPRETTIPLALVTEVKQADRIMEINRLLSRLERRGNVVLPPRFAGLEEGDWVAWQSARRHKGGTVKYRIEAYREPETWRKYLTLREIASSVFGVPDPVEDTTVPMPPPVVVDALALTGVIAEAITLPGEFSVLPAVRFKWDTPADAAVLAIRAEVRRVGETDAAPTRIDDVAKGQANVTNGVGPDQALECRLVPIGDPSRPVLASIWITVPTSGLVAGDVWPEAPGLSEIKSSIDAAFGDIFDVSGLLSDARTDLDKLGTEIAGARGGQANLGARVAQLAQATSDGDEANALLISGLTARTDSTEADIIDLDNAVAAEAISRAESIREVVARSAHRANLIDNPTGAAGFRSWNKEGGPNTDAINDPEVGRIFVVGAYMASRVYPASPGQKHSLSYNASPVGGGHVRLQYITASGATEGVRADNTLDEKAVRRESAAPSIAPVGTTGFRLLVVPPPGGVLPVWAIKVNFGDVATDFSDDYSSAVLEASVTEQTLAIIDLENNQALAGFRKIAEASGGAPAYYEFVSSSSGGYAAIAGPVVALVNTAVGGAAPLVALEAVNGEVRVARRLYVGSGAGQFLIDAPNQIQTLRDASGNLRLELGLLP